MKHTDILLCSALLGEVIEAADAGLVCYLHRRFGRPNTIISVDNGMSVMACDASFFFSLPVDFAKCVGMIVCVRLYM
jgi:hypothetical protein